MVINLFKKKLLFIILIFTCLHLKAQNKILAAQNEITEVARIFNSELPIKIDDSTTMIIVNYDNRENELAYFFRVEDYYNSELISLGVENFIKKYKISQIKYIRSSPNNKAFLIAQLNFVFIYLDATNRLILKYKITPKEYN